MNATTDSGQCQRQPAEGQSFQDWLESRIARFETRRYDWDALKFQADFDPKYRRAQMRYMGTGGTGVKSDMNTVPAEHFTFSTMVLPAGCEGRCTSTATPKRCSLCCAAGFG